MARKTAQEIVDGFDTIGIVETRNWITSASVPELVDFCHKAGSHVKFCTMVELARAELALKTAEASERVHWTVRPNFWLTLIACLAAIVAAWFAWRSDFRERSREVPASHGDLSGAPVQSPLSGPPSNSPALKP